MASGNWFDAQQLLELYLLDYFVKNNMHETAEIFRKEAHVPRHSVAIDVPDGFLYEWWCAFHDIFNATQLKHQGFETETSSEVVNMTENLSSIPHSMALRLASDHQSSKQFHIRSDFDMIGEPAASFLAANFYKGEQFERSIKQYNSNLSFPNTSNANLLNSATSSRHPQQQIWSQALQQNNIQGFDLGETALMDPTLYGAQRAVFPIHGIWGAGMNGGVNLLPPNEWSLNPLHSSLQAPNHQQQFQMSIMKHQPEFLAPTQSLTPENLTLNCPGSSANFACRDSMLPRMNLSGKNAQMVVRVRKSGEHQLKLDQPQHQQLEERGGRKNKSISSIAKDKILDCMNDKDKEPVDKNVESVPSLDVTVDAGAPSRIVKRKPAASNKNKHKAP